MMKKLDSNQSDLDNGKARQRIGEGNTFGRPRRRRRRKMMVKTELILDFSIMVILTKKSCNFTWKQLLESLVANRIDGIGPDRKFVRLQGLPFVSFDWRFDLRFGAEQDGTK